MSEDNISYRELKKGEVFVLDFRDTEILALKLPTKKRIGLGTKASVGETVGGEVSFGKGEEAEWQVFVNTKDFGVMPLENWKGVLSSTITNASGNTVRPEQLIVNISLSVAEPIADPSLEYQIGAITQVLSHYKRSTGKNETTTGQLDRMLKEELLRDGINPLFEPLSLSKVMPGLAELQKRGYFEIRESGRIIILG